MTPAEMRANAALCVSFATLARSPAQSAALRDLAEAFESAAAEIEGDAAALLRRRRRSRDGNG